MAKAPVCKLCQKAHWSYEPHGPTAEAPEYVKEMAAINTAPAIKESVTHPPGGECVTKVCNACNKPHSNRGGVCNACRQAAYRERKR